MVNGKPGSDSDNEKIPEKKPAGEKADDAAPVSVHAFCLFGDCTIDIIRGFLISDRHFAL